MLRQAYELSGRLPRRERRILRARYVRFYQVQFQAAADTLRRLSEAYPDDPTVWYQLGEVLWHDNVPGGWPEADRAFARAVKLDSSTAPPHNHLVDLAFSLHHDSSLAVRRIKAHPDEQFREAAQLPKKLVFGSAERRQETLAGLPRISGAFKALPGGLPRYVRYPTDGTFQEKTFRRLLTREDLGRGTRAHLRGLLVKNSLERGQVKKALTQLPGRHLTSRMSSFPLSSCLLAGAISLDVPVPDSTLHSYLEPSRIEKGASVDRLMCAGLYLVEQGRGEEVPAVISRLREAGTQQSVPEAGVQVSVNELKGYRAWKAGDMERATKLWSGSNQAGRRGAVWRGDLYRRLGRLKKAEGWYQAAWSHPVAHERLGRLYEKRGKMKKARAAYRRFVEAWENADPGLQDRVETARQRLQVLGKKATE